MGCAVLHGQGTGDGGEHGANEFKYLEYFCPVYFHIDQEFENLSARAMLALLAKNYEHKSNELNE